MSPNLRVLLIHQHFRFPEEGGSTRSFHVAQKLLSEGIDVTILSGHSEKKGLFEKDALRVQYFRIPYDNSMGFYPRIVAFWRFVGAAKNFIKKNPGWNLAYVMTTPLTTGFIARYLKNKFKIPYFFEVGDLWPQIPVEMGILRNKWLVKWLFKQEQNFYDEAHTVIAMSPDIAANIQSRSGTQTVVIPNFSDNDFFQPTFRSNPVTAAHPFRVIYCGTFGRANNLDMLLDLASSCLNNLLPVNFTLMGDGFAKKHLTRRINAEHLTNVEILPMGNKGAVRNQLKVHDAVFTSFAAYPTLATGSPNKFFDALAAGKITLINFKGWLSRLIEQEGIGLVISIEKPDSFLKELPQFFQLTQLREAQERARQLGEKHFDKELLTRKLAILIKDACS